MRAGRGDVPGQDPAGPSGAPPTSPLAPPTVAGAAAAPPAGECRVAAGWPRYKPSYALRGTARANESSGAEAAWSRLQNRFRARPLDPSASRGGSRAGDHGLEAPRDPRGPGECPMRERSGSRWALGKGFAVLRGRANRLARRWLRVCAQPASSPTQPERPGTHVPWPPRLLPNRGAHTQGVPVQPGRH